MAEEIQPFCEENLVNAIGGCCGSTPEHIAAIAGGWRKGVCRGLRCEGR
jgi:methionine synthase I (cobalamin-dependent)